MKHTSRYFQEALGISELVYFKHHRYNYLFIMTCGYLQYIWRCSIFILKINYYYYYYYYFSLGPCNFHFGVKKQATPGPNVSLFSSIVVKHDLGCTRLTHFRPVFPFYTPWKRQKTFGFLTFSGGIEREHWPEMG